MSAAWMYMCAQTAAPCTRTCANKSPIRLDTRIDIMSIDLTRLAKELNIYPGKHLWPRYEPLLARFASRMLEEAAKQCDRKAAHYGGVSADAAPPSRIATECAATIRALAEEIHK